MGTLEVVKGPMFARKTTTFIERVNAYIAKGGSRLVVIKHKFDNRYDNKTPGKSLVHSHDGITLNYATLAISQLVDADTAINMTFAVDEGGYLCIDEGQFFQGLAHFVADIRRKFPHIDVLIAGLDMDFRGEPFGDIPELFSRADKPVQLYARCVCGSNHAAYTHRKVNNSGTILVGGADIYEPLCEICYMQARVM